MKRLMLAVIVLGFGSLSFAAPQTNSQQEAAVAQKQAALAVAVPSSPFATNTCSYTFTSGSANTYLQYCVTVNGNIFQVTTPAGHSQIGLSSSGEGYGVCDVTGGNTPYSDFGLNGTTSNWNSPTLVSHTTTVVKIARTTSDGAWTLTQTITQVASSASIKVVMALKNNTGVARTVDFLRYADVDADGQTLDNLDGTHNTAMAWTSTGAVNGYGFILQNVGNSPFVTYDGFVQNTPAPPDPCNYTQHFNSGVLTNTDGSLVLVYVGIVPANGTKTFNMMYKGL